MQMTLPFPSPRGRVYVLFESVHGYVTCSGQRCIHKCDASRGLKSTQALELIAAGNLLITV